MKNKVAIVSIISFLITVGAFTGYVLYHNKSSSKSVAILLEESVRSRHIEAEIISYTALNNAIENYSANIRKLESAKIRIESDVILKTFYKENVVLTGNKLTNKRVEFEESLLNLSDVLSYVRSDSEELKNLEQEYRSLVAHVASNIDNKKGVNEVRGYKRPLNGIKIKSENFRSRVNRESNKKVFDHSGEDIRKKIYADINSSLTRILDNEKQLQAHLDGVITQQNNQLARLRTISSNFLNSSNGINAIYQNILPLLRNTEQQLRPVRDAMRTLEQPIAGTGMFGSRSVTPLSIIRDIDPVTGQTMVLIRDFTEYISRTTGQVQRIANTIEPIRQASNDFRSNPTREKAIVLNDNSQRAKQFLNEHKNLFDPILEKTNNLRSNLYRFEMTISRVRVQGARNMLYQFHRSANNTIQFVEQPARVFKSNIEDSIRQIDELKKQEDDYTSLINRVKNHTF